MTTAQCIDLSHLDSCLKCCVQDTGDIDIEHFLLAFKELNKFCELLGGVLFNAVSGEIESKSEIIRTFFDKDRNNFSTLMKMIEYERSENVLHNGVCGSRTMLVLMRGLDFVRLFFDKTYRLNDRESTSSAGREAYDLSLANHHGFFIRQGVYMCLWSLPTKRDLYQKVLGNYTNDDLQSIEGLVESLKKVYDSIFEIYESKSLLQLP